MSVVVEDDEGEADSEEETNELLESKVNRERDSLVGTRRGGA